MAGPAHEPPDGGRHGGSVPAGGDRRTEVEAKLAVVREAMAGAGLGAVRLRGTDWFAWATAGGSSTVLLAAEEGVAEVVVTPTDAWVVTDEIEAARLAEEEVPASLPVWAAPWTEPDRADRFVGEAAAGAPVSSDRPTGAEVPLPEALVATRWSLVADELARYRALGRDAAEAATEALGAASPTWSGHRLAAEAARALWERGIHPTLTLVGDERRLPRHRHATASSDPLGGLAMLVVCGRRAGLYANLTRFVAFRPLTEAERSRHEATLVVEAAALSASVPGASLGAVYDAVVSAYADVGHPGAARDHHQGGPCGYLSRDALALPGGRQVLGEHNAVAWNPSLPAAKVEDTIVTSTADGLEVLTVDGRWPTTPGPHLPRPAVLDRT